MNIFGNNQHANSITLWETALAHKPPPPRVRVWPPENFGGSRPPPYVEALRDLQPNGPHAVPYPNSHWNQPNYPWYEWSGAQQPRSMPCAALSYQSGEYQIAGPPPPLMLQPPQSSPPHPLPQQRTASPAPAAGPVAPSPATNRSLEELVTLIVKVAGQLLPSGRTQVRPRGRKRRRRIRKNHQN